MSPRYTTTWAPVPSENFTAKMVRNVPEQMTFWRTQVTQMKTTYFRRRRKSWEVKFPSIPTVSVPDDWLWSVILKSGGFPRHFLSMLPMYGSVLLTGTRCLSAMVSIMFLPYYALFIPSGFLSWVWFLVWYSHNAAHSDNRNHSQAWSHCLCETARLLVSVSCGIYVGFLGNFTQKREVTFCMQL